MSEERFELGFTTESMLAAVKEQARLRQQLEDAKWRRERLEWRVMTFEAVAALLFGYWLLNWLGVLP